MDDPNACLECFKEGRSTNAWIGFGHSVSPFTTTKPDGATSVSLSCIPDATATGEWTCVQGHRLRGGLLYRDLFAACGFPVFPSDDGS